MDITVSPVGKVIKAAGNYNAFVPAPLPPKLEWTNQLVDSISRANFLIGQLARESSRLSNPHLLIRPFVAREAVLSSKIEGTQATIGEILAHEAGANLKTNRDDLQEVNNYVEALDYGLERLKDFPLSLRLIREIHSKLMSGVRGGHATPGEFRKSQNWIGKPGSTLETATFVPPPPEELMTCLGQFEEFLHNREVPTLIQLAMCHYQFEAIHPFLDGNGRVGRLLISLLLVERGILEIPVLYLSAFFEATRREYYESLLGVSAQGKWNDWLIYFLNGIAVQSEDVLSRAMRINQLIENWSLQAASQSHSGGSMVEIVRCMSINPYLTASKITQHTSMAFTTASRGLAKLETLNIIQLVSGDKRNKVYCATEILKILEEEAKIYPDHSS
jgi:Fic family protein